MSYGRWSGVTDRRALAMSLITGFILSACAFLGYGIDRFGEMRICAGSVLSFALTLIIGAAGMYLFLVKGRAISDRICGSGKTDDDPKRVGSLFSFPTRLIWAIILICQIPVLLAEFPGFFVYDAVDEYVAVATRTFTVHHPLLHTLMLGGSVYAGEVLFDSANTGIFLYIALQMTVLSYIFARIVSRQKHFVILSALFYGLFPTVVMFTLCSVKDTLFSAAVLCSIVQSLDIADRVREARDTYPGMKKDLILLGISLAFMMLMRHNGVYAAAVSAVVTTCVIRGMTHKGTGTDAPVRTDEKSKGQSFKAAAYVAVTFVCAIAAYMIMSAGLKAVLVNDEQQTEHQEMLTVPIQQLARVYSVYGSEWTNEERDELFAYIPEEGLNHYTPQLSDPVKMYFDNAAYEQNAGGFWNIWARQFASHPAAYINAWLNTCYGYFYPPAVVNVYEGHTVYTFTYTESSYFGYEVEYPGERHSLIPLIDRFYKWLSLDDDIQRIPVISLFFSMGALLWLCVIGMGSFIYKKDLCAASAFTLPFAVMATLLLGPTFLPRYAVFLWFAAPVLIGRVFSAAQSGDKNK